MMTDQELEKYFQKGISRRADEIRYSACSSFFAKFPHHFSAAIAGIDLEELRAEAVIDKQEGGINDLCNLVRERLWSALSSGGVIPPHDRFYEGPNPYKEYRGGSGQTISPKGHQAPVQVKERTNDAKKSRTDLRF